MRILVTGGAGLIGSNLTRRLSESGVDVIVADNLWRGKIGNLYSNGSWAIDVSKNFFEYDLRNYKKCLELTKTVDTVVHLADIVGGINYVFANELFVFRSNNCINSNILDASIVNGVEKFLYVGTACSYPVEKQSKINMAPLKEEDVYPANPESSYGWSKLMGEYECELAQREKKIDTAVLRLHNVFGPPCDLTPEKSQVIPALCRKAINSPIEEFIVWGTGTQRRAFLYVDDVVEALITSLDKAFGKGVIQIGPQKSHSISEIAEMIVQISGKEICIKYDHSKPEGDKDRVADNQKSRELLGWSPTVSIEEGLARTYGWAYDQLMDIQ